MSKSVASIHNCFALPLVALMLTSCWLSADRVHAQEMPPSEMLLPANTKAWISIPDSEVLKAAIEKTQFGKMMEDEDVKPFMDDLTAQFRNWLNNKNIKFGMKVADIESVKSGEISVAGVLKMPAAGAASANAQNAPVEHAIVLLVDVSDSIPQTEELLKKVAEKLEGRNATQEELKIGDVSATKWSFEKPPGLREKQYAYHAIAGRWLLACDNEAVFRQMIRRIIDPDNGTPVLAESPAFVKINEQCQFSANDFTTHIRWFVEPFGYVQLAQAISDANNGRAELRDNYADKFQEQGFSAIKGLGGVVALATGEHELVHRTFIHAPPDGEGPERYQRAAAMLDFSNPDKWDLSPPRWVPQDAASYVSLSWNLGKALEKVGYIIDATAGTSGSWERTLNGIRDDLSGPRVDVRALTKMLENRVTVATATELPVDETSERILIGIRILDNEEQITDDVRRIVQAGEKNFQIIEHGESEILVVDTTIADEDPDLEFLNELDELDIGDDPLDENGGEDMDEDEEIVEPKPLFEKRVFVVTNGFFLLGNDVEYVKKVVDRMAHNPGKALAESGDYSRVNQALDELVKSSAPSLRHFGRIDQSIRANYEMMRQGKMPQSKTILAQMLNRAFTADDAPEDFVRTQQIDGSKMPADFEGHVAKYFGPAGTLVQTLDEGWLITGCILEKQEQTAVPVGTENESTEKPESVQQDQDSSLIVLPVGNQKVTGPSKAEKSKSDKPKSDK